MEQRSYGEMPPISVGADSPVAGLVDRAYGLQWARTGVGIAGPSLGKGEPSPLQVAGPDVLYQHILQVVGPHAAGLTEVC